VKTTLILAACGLLACCPPARAERFDCTIFRNFQAQMTCYDNLSRGPEPKEAQRETQKPAAAKPQASSTRQRKHKAD
jgi:hypothetical protein